MSTRSAALVAPTGRRRREEGMGRVSLRLALAMLAILAGTALAFAQDGAASPAAKNGLWDELARFIVSPWATVALLVVGCLLLFIDLLTPHTWGLMGTAGVLAVVLVFAAHITAGTAGWVGVMLFLAGLVFLLVETHVFPGHGMAAVAGLMLLFLGMFYALGGSGNAVFAMSVATILTTLSLIAFFAYLPKSPVWKKLGQQMQQRASLGYVTSENLMHFLGRTGTAATVLRPSGAALIDGERLDVVTEGEFLEPGTPVMVIKVEGSRIVVDNIEAVAAEEDAASQAA